MTACRRLKVFMANLPGILFYLCAALFVPLVIARLVVGAEWRAIYHQWRQRFSLPRMSAAQWASIAALSAGFVLIVYWQDQRDLDARAGVLRQLFELPAEVTFVDLRRISKSSVKAPRVEAVARFTPSQFDVFVAGLDRQAIWQHGAPAYDGAPLEVAAPESLRWRALPVPSYAGNTRVSWRSLSETDVAKMRRGRVLCIALQFKPRTPDERSGDTSPRFSANDCSALAHHENGATIALGALDFDTRKLHMILN